MEEHFKTATGYAAMAIEVVAAVILLAAVAHAGVRLLVWLVRRDRPAREAVQQVRLSLGQWLVLSLELLLAADILQTAVAPTWDELGKLAAIIVLRTILNYFLERELDAVARPDRHAAVRPS